MTESASSASNPPIPTPTPTPTSNLRENVATGVAVVVIVGLGLVYGFMLTNLDLPDKDWTRILTVLSGIEAVVFGAAGFLFGTSIQRGQVKKAEAEADKERTQARKAEKTAERGTMLAKQILAKSTAPSQAPGAQPPGDPGLLGGKKTRSQGPSTAATGVDRDLAELQAMAMEVLR